MHDHQRSQAYGLCDHHIFIELCENFPDDILNLEENQVDAAQRSGQTAHILLLASVLL